MREYLPALLALTAACGSGPLPPTPTSRLTLAADTVTLQDTDLGDAVWLGGDRWALLASQAKTVRIVDFATKRTRPLGRPGRDYQEPYAIFRAGDSLYVSDWGMRRVTAWSLTGVANKLTPTVNIYVAARDAQTRITLEQQLGSTAGAIFGGIGGGVGGGGIMLPIAAALISPFAVPVAVAAWLGGTYAACRRLYRSRARVHAERLDTLLDDLATIATTHIQRSTKSASERSA